MMRAVGIRANKLASQPMPASLRRDMEPELVGYQEAA